MEKLWKRISNTQFLNFNVYSGQSEIRCPSCHCTIRSVQFVTFVSQIYCVIKEVALTGLFAFIYLPGAS